MQGIYVGILITLLLLFITSIVIAVILYKMNRELLTAVYRLVDVTKENKVLRSE